MAILQDEIHLLKEITSRLFQPRDALCFGQDLVLTMQESSTL